MKMGQKRSKQFHRGRLNSSKYLKRRKNLNVGLDFEKGKVRN